MSSTLNNQIGSLDVGLRHGDPRTTAAPNWLAQAQPTDVAAVADRFETAALLKSGKYRMTFVIPLYNEEGSLPELYRRIKSAAVDYAPNHEIIFIDDGSRDASFASLLEFWRKDQSVIVLRFRRNQGKAAALTAGFDRASGDIVVMMDADLQDQPEEIPLLISKLDEGYDLVTGWKQKRHDPLNKTLPSKLFNGTVSRYFKLDIHDFNCGLKVMRTPVARSLQIYGDFHRFIPVLAASKGFRVTECAVEHAPRVHGVSKYGAKRLITGMLDFMSSILVTRFYHKPLQMFGGLGLSIVGVGIWIGLYLLVESILGGAAHLRPLWIVMSVLFVAGAQVICTGLLGELLVSAIHRKNSLYDIAEAFDVEQRSMQS